MQVHCRCYLCIDMTREPTFASPMLGINAALHATHLLLSTHIIATIVLNFMLSNDSSLAIFILLF